MVGGVGGCSAADRGCSGFGGRDKSDRNDKSDKGFSDRSDRNGFGKDRADRGGRIDRDDRSFGREKADYGHGCSTGNGRADKDRADDRQNGRNKAGDGVGVDRDFAPDKPDFDRLGASRSFDLDSVRGISRSFSEAMDEAKTDLARQCSGPSSRLDACALDTMADSLAKETLDAGQQAADRTMQAASATTVERAREAASVIEAIVGRGDFSRPSGVGAVASFAKGVPDLSVAGAANGLAGFDLSGHGLTTVDVQYSAAVAPGSGRSAVRERALAADGGDDCRCHRQPCGDCSPSWWAGCLLRHPPRFDTRWWAAGVLRRCRSPGCANRLPSRRFPRDGAGSRREPLV